MRKHTRQAPLRRTPTTTAAAAAAATAISGRRRRRGWRCRHRGDRPYRAGGGMIRRFLWVPERAIVALSHSSCSCLLRRRAGGGGELQGVREDSLGVPGAAAAGDTQQFERFPEEKIPLGSRCDPCRDAVTTATTAYPTFAWRFPRRRLAAGSPTNTGVSEGLQQHRSLRRVARSEHDLLLVNGALKLEVQGQKKKREQRDCWRLSLGGGGGVLSSVGSINKLFRGVCTVAITSVHLR